MFLRETAQTAQKNTRQKSALHLALVLRSMIVGKVVQMTFLQAPSLSI